MDNKTWLVEMEIAVCFVAVAFVALTLMLGNTLWKSLAGKWQHSRNTPLPAPASKWAAAFIVATIGPGIKFPTTNN